MFGIFRKDPRKRLEKQIAAKLEKARDVQRSGDLKAYARLMDEIDQMESSLEQLSP